MALGVRRITSVDGERHAILVDAAGMPLFYPTLWVTAIQCAARHEGVRARAASGRSRPLYRLGLPALAYSEHCGLQGLWIESRWQLVEGLGFV